ncbi:hypothetical protein K3718_05895 [Leisingera aquaemixtae]|uniref:ATP-dependent Clp protease proteolytic subunit n=1 Tax=Leisingera aquaemixtae TaxID=1396826 RepID=A0ABY5WM77_9RHOB|nr:hypothetical protein [Leisingera aquaemixtae]UWQ42618.1 hypothetical protein K3718_05895 [Leisingera aquaemixtae]
MSALPPPLPRSLALQVVLPRGGLVLGWLALNQWVRLPVPLAFVLMAADGLFLLWQARAFQLSADAHVRSTGAMMPVWGGYLVLLFAGFAALILWWDTLLIARAVEEPAYAEQRRLEREAKYSLRVSGDGLVLIFDGEITHGLTRRMDAVLAAAPEVRRVRLAGPGGLIYEARGAAKLIRRHQLDTEAATLCASACTLIFAAGRTRRLAAGGQLGFHGYALMFEGGLPQVDLQKEQQKDLAFFEQQGIRGAFARQIFAVGNGELWIPSHPDLRAAGVLTGEAH